MDERDLEDLDECSICGAAIAKSGRHYDWHAKNGEERPKRSGKVWGF